MPTLLVLVSLLLPGQTSRPVDLKNLPADWPPLPDFKHTVDYVKWCEERVNGDITDDARPLWDELSGNDNASEEAQETNHLLWGEDKNGGIPGLLTGSQVNNSRKAWDPLDFPEWEEAYQKQRTHGLYEKLIEVSKRPRLSMRMNWVHQSDGSNQVYSMFTAEDRLLLTGLLPSLASHRQATKVLLQNAWRAPDGNPDTQAMEEAFVASLRLAQQVEHSGPTIIGLLVGTSIRQYAYQHIMEMLQEHGFSPAQVARINNWLARNDRGPLSWEPAQAGEIAYMLDLLQYVYLPENGRWQEGPRPNVKNVEKLAQYIEASKEAWPQMAVPNLDLAGEIVRCDPRTAVADFIRFELDLRGIWRHHLPFEAASKHEQRREELVNNPTTHVVLRQFGQGVGYSFLGRITAEQEAARRATRIILAFHLHRGRTGKWPARLSEFRPILPPSIRIDPFSGKPFIYRLENGQPLLYSAGYNAKDDGGKHTLYRKQEEEKDGVSVAVEADYVYWPVQRDK